MRGKLKDTSDVSKLVLSETSIRPPKVVGSYRLGNQTNDYIEFNLSYKPKWLHRQMMRIFFGWYWFDTK